jgi:hypothetical protein
MSATTVTPTPTNSTTIGSGQNPSGKVSGGVIGGVVAGVIIVSFLGIVVLFRYRNRKARRPKTVPDQMQSEPLGTAFTTFGRYNLGYLGQPEEPLAAPKDNSNVHVTTGARLSRSTDLLLSGGEKDHELAGINLSHGIEDQK